MNCHKIIQSLEASHFAKIVNNGTWLETHSHIYAKEIKETVFLLFLIAEEKENMEDIRALIAQFDNINNIGKQEPKQILFYLSIKKKYDLHYLKKFMKVDD